MISAKEMREKINNEDQIAELIESRFISAFIADIEKNALALSEMGKTQFPESFTIRGQNKGLEKVDKTLNELGYSTEVSYGDEASFLLVGWAEGGLVKVEEDKDE